MNRLSLIARSAVVVSLVAVGGEARAQVRDMTRAPEPGIRPVAAAALGSLEGVVLDEQGAPVSGAAVSAVGPSSQVAIADLNGRFRVRSLPPGPYLVRAHLVGYTPSRRQFIEVRPSVRTTVSMAMHRTELSRMLAAGMGGDAAAPGAGAPDPDADDHSELAWRLRHLPRSVLKDSTGRLALPDADSGPDASPFFPGGVAVFARALGSSARFASTMFGDMSVTGELNLLTTGSFDSPQALFSTDRPSRGVAYLSLRGLAGVRGSWTMQAIVTQGDVGSWVIGGTFASRVASRRSYQLGGSYSAQRYLVGTGSLALPASEGSRAAGSMFFADRWTLSPHVTLDYVARYSKYGYLAGPGLFSPRVSVTIAPAVHTRVVATVSRRMLAPGAEEFLPAITPGLWVPPARSFDRLSPGESFTAERTLHYEVAVERDFAHRYVVSVRGFRQRVHDQRTALFDLGLIPGATGDSSHYAIARVGDVSATGWSVGVSDMLGPYVRGSVNYEFASTRWFGPGDLALLAALAPSVVRPATEQIQDLNTSLETDIPVTATRLVVLYRVNTAFARGDRSAAPGLGDRFDVQVTQRLPFLDFTSAQWQVLVAVRNMFRDPGQYGSLYDELLVVEPPKRIVGGVLVRF